jgi:hypothetical protein
MEISKKVVDAVTSSETANAQKEAKKERFGFDLFINENLICERSFRINDFIEQSMETMEFKNEMDNIMSLINEDLKSKTRIYTWYNFYHAFYQAKMAKWRNDDTGEIENKIAFVEDPTEIPAEFSEELLQPWECTFKMVITDRDVPIFTQIWDGYGYCKYVRKNVDITNKWVKWSNRDGKTFAVLKDEYFADKDKNLSPEMLILKAMIMDKPNISNEIIRKICNLCSYSNNGYQKIGDYTTVALYKTKDEEGRKLNEKKYPFSYKAAQRRVESEWGKVVSDKTKKYFASLY